MSEFERFRYKTLDDLQAALDRLGLRWPLDADFGVLAEPLSLGGHTVPNRFAIHPMEGCDSSPQGTPTELTRRRYRRFAAGGAGLLWFEACAVVAEGRANPRQMMLTEANKDAFRVMLDECRREAEASMGAGHRPVCILQLTHSGRYSRPNGKPEPIIAQHSAVLDPVCNIPADYPLITDDELDRLQDAYLASAALAEEVGFDGVDVKSCHGYLLAELFGAFTRPASRYGGESFENRTRMTREVHRRIAEAHPNLIVTARMNAYDPVPYPYGWGSSRDNYLQPDPAEPIRLAGELSKQGAPCLNVTIANPYYLPHFNRPYDFPIVGFEPPEEHPLRGVERIVAIARAIQQALPGLAIVGSGYTYLREFMPYLAAGVLKQGWATLIGLGRGAFAYPDFARDILRRGAMDRMKTCIACSCCTQIMRDGGTTGCVIRDSEVYGPIFREGRRLAQDRIRAEADRCRTCTAPTCQAACPAGVDVPAFVEAAADGDFQTAYDILRQSNPLPELCAYICPVAEQCEGSCIEATISGRPVPIRDIQRHVARVARQQGWAKLRIPPTATGRRMAVVGAGPAGLACATRLLELGHSVTVFEQGRRMGGIGRDTIPAERLDASDVENELRAMLADAGSDRLVWRFNAALGRDMALDDLLAEDNFDAVFLGIGLSESTPLQDGATPPRGVETALAFLRRMKDDPQAMVPRRVAVLGGGNTAMDAAVTAVRRGAEDVYLVYRRSFPEMPAWPEEREAAMTAGVHFLILTQPMGYQAGADGELRGVHTMRTTLGPADASGRRRPVTLPNSSALLDVDIVIEALGQRPAPGLAGHLPGVEFSSRGYVTVDPATGQTTRRGVYAGGDIAGGSFTAAAAVAGGVLAARSIDKALRTSGVKSTDD